MKRLKRSNIITLIIPILIIFLFNHCMHDEFELDKLDTDIEINASLLTPLAYGSLTLDDLISELDSSGYINTYPDGLLYLAYEDSLFSYIADELMEVPDQDFYEFFIKSYFNLPTGWTDVSLDTTDYFAFSFSNNEQLDSIQLDQGDLVFSINSSFQCDGVIRLIFPTIVLNGSPFVTDPFNINDPTEHIISMDGHTIILQDSSGTTDQFIPVDFEVDLFDPSGPILNTDSIKLTAGIANLDFDAIFGYIGDYELITETGEVDLGFFESALDGDIRFEDPQINFKIRNSYGVPAEVEIQKFTGFKSETDSTELTFNTGVNPFSYAFPTLDDYNSGTYFKDTTISLDRTTTNISDFLAYLPNRLEYNLKAVSNPPTPSGDTIYNFVTDESRIDVDFEFILPLWFTADNFAFVDTIEADLEGVAEEADIIEKVTMMLEVANGLPVDIDFQVYFVDSLYNPVDTLFDNNSQPIIAAGITELDDTYTPPSLRVTTPNNKISVVELTGDDIVNLETVKYGIIRAGLKTPGDPGSQDPALFYSDYSVSFNLSVGVNVSGEVEIE